MVILPVILKAWSLDQQHQIAWGLIRKIQASRADKLNLKLWGWSNNPGFNKASQ